MCKTFSRKFLANNFFVPKYFLKNFNILGHSKVSPKLFKTNDKFLEYFDLFSKKSAMLEAF